MVIETPEGLTLVEPAENSSFYIVQENEGQETPPSMTKNVMVSNGSFLYILYLFMVKACWNAVLIICKYKYQGSKCWLLHECIQPNTEYKNSKNTSLPKKHVLPVEASLL